MILCCGEALIDMIPQCVSEDVEGFVPHAGGAVFNTAIALGRLGVPVGFLTGLSTDMFGAQLDAALQESNVRTDLVIRSDRPTTLAFVKVTDGQARYSFYDENTAGRMLENSQIPDLSSDVSALYFGGISLISEPAADFYAEIAQRYAASRLIMIDPNIRPGFIQSEERYRARLNQMIRCADVVKVSDEDLEWIFPGAGGLATKAERLLADGPSIAIVTKGREGAQGFCVGGESVSVPALGANVVDTVGAGDTFNAGFLAGLSEMEVLTKDAFQALSVQALKDALSYGAQVASITVSRAGANPPWAHELGRNH